jgi:hypothetical protein
MRKAKKGYLCGLINPNSMGSYLWRKQIREMMSDTDMEFIDPLRGKSDTATDPTCKSSEGMNATTICRREIVMRDYNDVKRADIIIVCMDKFNSPRPPTGTLYELAWAWQLRIPVIAFDFGEPFYPDHPFIAESITVWVPNGLGGCVKRLKEYWL